MGDRYGLSAGGAIHFRGTSRASADGVALTGQLRAATIGPVRRFLLALGVVVALPSPAAADPWWCYQSGSIGWCRMTRGACDLDRNGRIDELTGDEARAVGACRKQARAASITWFDVAGDRRRAQYLAKLKHCQGMRQYLLGLGADVRSVSKCVVVPPPKVPPLDAELVAPGQGWWCRPPTAAAIRKDSELVERFGKCFRAASDCPANGVAACVEVEVAHGFTVRGDAVVVASPASCEQFRDETIAHELLPSACTPLR